MELQKNMVVGQKNAGEMISSAGAFKICSKCRNPYNKIYEVPLNANKKGHLIYVSQIIIQTDSSSKYTKSKSN